MGTLEAVGPLVVALAVAGVPPVLAVRLRRRPPPFLLGYALALGLLVVWTVESITIADASADHPPAWPAPTWMAASLLCASVATASLLRGRSRLGFRVTVGLAVLSLVVGGVSLYRDTRPCGWGARSPEAAVSGALNALQQHDERALCQVSATDVAFTTSDQDVLRQRVIDSGGPGELTVRDLRQEQLGAAHVVSVASGDGVEIARFQTLLGEHGTVVVRVSTTPGGVPAAVASRPTAGP